MSAGPPAAAGVLQKAAVVAVLALAACGGVRLEDRTTAPTLPSSALEVVADLDYPPGNIAVSPTGRIFLTLHPDGDPPLQLAELVNGRPVPFPDAEFQHAEKGTPHFQSLLSVRLDRQGRLWTLDFARYPRGQPA